MESNKFEENIRTKFEERELQPSAEAWSKLEAQLGAPKSSNKTLWYAIAASLVALLVVGSFLLKENKAVSNELVEQNIPSESIKNTEVVTSEEDKALENINTENNTSVKTDEILPQKKQELIANTTENVLENGEEKSENREEIKDPPELAFPVRAGKRSIATTGTAIVQVEKEHPKTEALEKIIKEDFINLKVSEVVAQVENLKTQNSTITTEDVEALLQKAQRDIANQRLLQQATTTIDPASLLNDVESELERGFRDKVFDALGEGFNKVRTAVLERNN